MTLLPEAPLTLADVRQAAPRLASTASRTGAGRKLLNLLYQADADLVAVERAVSSEPTVAARVVKVANMAYYGVPGGVGSVRQALNVLGLDAIKGIAAAACMDRHWVGEDAAACMNVRQFMLHSLGAAVAARQLDRAVGTGAPAELFLAGLLHDLGVVMLWRLRPSRMAATGQSLSGSGPVAGGGYAEIERSIVGMDHAQCAAAVFEAWQLPPLLIHTVGFHHEPAHAPHEFRVQAHLVSLAETVAAMGGYPCDADVQAPLEDDERLSVLGLQLPDVQAVAAELTHAVGALQVGLEG